MFQLYPQVKKQDVQCETFEKKDLNIVFLNPEYANVFTFLESFLKVEKGMSEKSNIIFSLKEELEEESYEINISKEKINIYYKDERGAFYASETLKQIYDQTKSTIKTVYIYDKPDLKVRGFMLDISRNKVPKITEIEKLIILMATLKMNHLELYVEGFSFYYPSFSNYCSEESSISIEEYKHLEEFANKYYIDLVPNQNGFGHMTKWLEQDEFKTLAECEEGIFLWGMNRKASTLNPLDPRSLELITKMYEDMLPISNSKYFNMNFDEPFELGKGKSKEECEKNGKENVYLDFALKAYELAKKHNKTPLIWGDVLINHPAVLDRIPKDMIFVDWGYDGSYPFEEHLKTLSSKGLHFMAAPGTTSWCSFAGRTMDYLETIKNSCYKIKEYNGDGAILTDWGDFGHLQFFPISYPALSYFGLMSWRCTDGTYFLLKDFLNKHVFYDKSNLIADFLLDLGNYYRYEDCYHGNGTKTFYAFMFMWIAMKEENPIKHFEEKIKNQLLPYPNYLLLENFLNQKNIELKMIELDSDDKYIVIDEIKQTIRIIKIIQKTAISYNDSVSLERRLSLLESVLSLKKTVLDEQKRLWLARNKSGNLNDTLSYLETFFKFSELTYQHLLRGDKDER